MAKYKYLFLHCTATIEGKEILPATIERMHMGCKLLSDGRIQYKGQKYDSKEDLPDDFIGSVHAKDTKGRGWDRVGYSKLFTEDGVEHTFVEHNDDNWISSGEMTWGAKGYNSVARHFVYAGGLSRSYYIKNGRKKHYHRNTMTTAQEYQLIRAIKKELKDHPDIVLIGHNQVDSKSCPCLDVRAWGKMHGIPENRIDQRELKVRLKQPF
jgi:hypothetical protein